MNYTQVFGMTLITVPSWVWTINQRLQPPHMMYCAVTRSRFRKDNHIHQLRRLHLSRVTMQISARQSQEIMEDHSGVSHATAASKCDNMR